MMTENHEPRMEFVADLEKQLTSELRRRRRFGPIDRSAGLKRFVKTALLLVLCATTGIAAAKTVEHIESSKEKVLNLAKVEAALEKLQARKRVADGLVTELKERMDAGLIHRDELAEAIFQSQWVESELEKAGLNLEETEITGRAPADELYAPLQGGRDFVTERLQIAYRQASARKEHIESKLAGVRKLVEIGMVHRTETDRLDSMFEEAAHELEDVQRRLDLRKDFLSGDLTTRQVMVRRMVSSARMHLGEAETSRKAAAAHLAEVSSANARGLVAERDVRQAEYEMISARADYRIAKIELELLEDELEK